MQQDFINDIPVDNKTFTDIINEIDFNHCKPIFIEKNSLVLASVNLKELIKFYLLVNPEENIYFYTNYEWLGIASLMSTLFNLCYQKSIFLSNDKNYNIYYNNQDKFKNIYIYGEKIAFQEMGKDFPKALWIDGTK